VGFFTSAGSRVIPEPVLQSKEIRESLRQKLHALPAIGKASRAWFVRGQLDDWIEMAKRGLFAFDFLSDDGSISDRGHYRRIAKPSRPLMVQTMPDETRAALARVTVPSLCFADSRSIEKGSLVHGR
jgi:hypothetical protein